MVLLKNVAMNCSGVFRSGLAAVLLVANAAASTVTLGPAQDSMVTEQFPGTPQGSNTVMLAGTNGKLESSRSLLAFDLTGIPSNAIVTSAALTVKVVKVSPGFPPAVTMDLRRILVAWDETEATWTNRLALVQWSTNGAAAPLDFSNAVTQTTSVAGQGTYTFVSNAGLMADVQSWISDPNNNFGWFIISEAQGTDYTECKFGTRDDPANAPSLAIQFTLPAAPPVLTAPLVANREFRFSFIAESNRTYAVEYRGSLPGTNWSILTNLPPLTASANVVVADPLTGSNRFYRVRTP